MRVTCSALALSAAILGVGTPAMAGVIRDDRPQAAYLALGASAAYASVGRIDGVTPSQRYLASGTLIAPDWVLTAGHVVDQASGLTFTVNGTARTADRWVANPNWTGNLLAGYDIGLIHLTAPVSDVAPAIRYSGGAELGEVATFVGYGMTGTGLTGATTLDYQKRAGSNVLDRYAAKNNPRLLLADFDNPGNRRDNDFGKATPLALEYLIAPGDSGGGVFMDTAAGAMLVGVNSFIGAFDGRTDADYGDYSGHTRVSAFNTWIDAVMTGTASGVTTAGALDTTAGVTPAFAPIMPEPASLGLLGLGAVGLLRWRRIA